MTKVLIWPFPTEQPANHGIGRIVHAQYRYLYDYGIELTQDPTQADIIACHTQQKDYPRVDCLHTHGLYWTGDVGSGVYHKWHEDANAGIISAARRARAITVPSEWIAECFKRDMRVTPTIIGHGIDAVEWTPGTNGSYILWNKNRPDDVCNPRYAYDLAVHGDKVVSTFAPEGASLPGSLTVTGNLPHAKMKELIRNADIYLATTKETFGIGTLEALACGVPILGFRQGGTADIVRHEQDGYLVEPGDIDGLLLGLAFIRKHRRGLSANARARAKEFTWSRVMEQYARLYTELASTPEPTGVSVIVPCYNYGRYLAACIESLLNQSYRPEQIIVVDDGSTDDSANIAARYKFQGVQYVHQTNQGVAAARNHGLSLATNPFIICLDADDQLAPRYVEVCRAEMMRDRALGIVYTGLEVFTDIGVRQRTGWPPDFNWEGQTTVHTPPSNCVPSAAMFRRSMWERAGGYKQEYAPGEDTEFWTRGLSVGFTAKRVTDMPWFWYRSHPDSAGRTRKYRPIDDWLPWMRDRNYPMAAPASVTPKVRSYSTPKVSVIIPVGPGHAQYLPQALDSLIGQTMREWECIVVNDNQDLIEVVGPYPFIKLFRTSKMGHIHGAGFARNIGLRVATAPLVLFLDADDMLDPQALAKLCRNYSAREGRYLYGDWVEITQGRSTPQRSPEYNPDAWLNFGDMSGKHIISVLMATEDARKVGGFDEKLPAWEDWDFFTKCAIAGIHGARIAETTLIVRHDLGIRTKHAFANQDKILSELAERYTKGKLTMAPCCGGNGESLLAARLAWEGTPPDTGGLTLNITTRSGNGGYKNMALQQGAPTDGVQPTRMEFIGERQGGVDYRGVADDRRYHAGNNALERWHNVHPHDVDKLLSSGDFRIVAVAVVQNFEPPPKAIVPEISQAERSEVEEEVEELPAIETGAGRVARKRVKRKETDSVLRDLPPLDK